MRHFPSLAAFGAQGAQRSVVAPSISSALDWLRTCVRERPNVRVQVIFRLFLVSCDPPVTLYAFAELVCKENISSKKNSAFCCMTDARCVLQVLVTGSLYLVGDVLKHLSKYL